MVVTVGVLVTAVPVVAERPLVGFQLKVGTHRPVSLKSTRELYELLTVVVV
jgi:hypothetical protein